MNLRRCFAAFACMIVPCAAWAHPGRAPAPHDAWRAWGDDPLAIALIVLAALMYARGATRLWISVGQGRGVPRWRVWCYAAGIFALFCALISPLDAIGNALFSAHMLQHLLLAVVAPPLLILGDPLVVLLWGCSPGVRRSLARWWLRARTLRTFIAVISRPAISVSLHLTALAAWHAPTLYDAALRNEWVHAAEHFSFFGSALLFWRLIADRRTLRHIGAPLACAALFAVAVEGTILGALLTLARYPWYLSHLTTTQPWGLTSLEDQQLAGLIMWIPGGLPYVLAAALLVAGALRQRSNGALRLTVRSRA